MFLSVLLLTQAQAQTSSGLTTATGPTTTNPTGSSSTGSSSPHHRSQGKNSELSDEDIQDIMTVAVIFYILFVVGIVAVGGFLLFRCWRKSQERQKVKDLMRQRRYNYATSMGMNLYQLNSDNRHNYVMHV